MYIGPGAKLNMTIAEGQWFICVKRRGFPVLYTQWTNEQESSAYFHNAFV